MAAPLFIWLGSGRARRRRVHPKGQFLDRAAQAGLPVPTGAILLDELYRVFLDKDLAHSDNGRITISDPELMHNTLFYSVRLPSFERPAAIRTAFASGGQPTPPRLNVNMNDAGAVASALSALWTAAAQAGGETRADVLVMDMVTAEHGGAAISRQDAPADETLLTGGTGYKASPLVLPRLGRWTIATGELSPYARRLQMLLRGVRRTFGQGDWQIDWLDDGRICYLIQVSRPGPAPAQV